ncbi:hypothetical protein TNCV_4837981 [Trichonephila clavipes]|nr:hypothetical protein TNCV_4837981 [Trichonephila clavipes]
MGRSILLERRQMKSVGRWDKRSSFLRSDWPRPFARRKVGVEIDWNLGGRTGKFLRQFRSLLKSKNQEINRLQLAVKLPWAIFFESVDILS